MDLKPTASAKTGLRKKSHLNHLEQRFMKTKNFFARSFCALAAATCLAGGAHAAIVIGGQAYNVSTPTESMSASFLSAAGGVSTRCGRRFRTA